MFYVLVSQDNWKEERINSKGKKYISVGFKPPQTLEQAKGWPGTKIIEADKPPIQWGHGTYAEDPVTGILKLVAADWDSSG